MYRRTDRAVASLVAGLLGLLLFLPLSPLAWYWGSRTLRSIDAGHVNSKERGVARAGQILGIVGTCFLAVVAALFLAALLLFLLTL